MKFSCRKNDLERAVSVAERFTGKNAALPILGAILLDARGKTITVTATNLEYALEWRLPASVAKEGKVSIPARIFSSVIQSMPDDTLDVSEERSGIRVRGGGREGKINGMKADDFPLVPAIKKTHSFSLSSAGCGSALARVLPAVSASEFKPELGGVLVRVARDTLTLAATDTFRLAEASIPLADGKGSGVDFSVILPHRAAQEAARIMDGEDGLVEIAMGENQMFLKAGPWAITSRLIEGAFPEYRAIIPTSFSASAHMKKSDLISAVRSSSVFASRLQEAAVRFLPDRIDVFAANPDIGEYKTSFPAARSGGDIAMSFNWRYLLDGAQALEEDDVFFGCNQETAPALLRNKSHKHFSYVVMPIRVS